MHYLGADIGYYDDLNLAKTVIKKYGGNIIQIFIIPGKKYISMYNNYTKNDVDSSIKIVVHASYTYNFCRVWDEYSWWIKSFQDDVLKACALGAEYIVLHFGKSLGMKKEEAYNNMYTSLLYLHDHLSSCNIQILLETPAGQGSEICSSIDDLAHFYHKIRKSPNKSFRNRVKICLDTCHVYAAGYMENVKGITDYFKEFNTKIGINNIKLVHLNDSKVKFGYKVDRHAGLGDGYIGIKNIVTLYNFFKDINIPIILETPGESYRKEIKKLLFS